MKTVVVSGPTSSGGTKTSSITPLCSRKACGWLWQAVPLWIAGKTPRANSKRSRSRQTVAILPHRITMVNLAPSQGQSALQNQPQKQTPVQPLPLPGTDAYPDPDAQF